jgi:Arc/MetJ-type ribon-helix-helix transcriptional regulator
MRRITISLPDEMADILVDEARRCRRSVSEVAREALIERLGLDESKPREIPFAGVGASKEGDLSERVDEILGEILDEKYERIRRQLREEREH